MIVLTESSDPADYRDMIRKWASPAEGSSPVEIMVVRLPFLTGSGLAAGRLSRVFGALRRGETVCLEGSAENGISVLPGRAAATRTTVVYCSTVLVPGMERRALPPFLMKSERDVIPLHCVECMLVDDGASTVWLPPTVTVPLDPRFWTLFSTMSGVPLLVSSTSSTL